MPKTDKIGVLRKAIDQFCKDCIYDPYWKGGGTWRQQVEGCPSKSCALYEIRPLPDPRDRSIKSESEDQ